VSRTYVPAFLKFLFFSPLVRKWYRLVSAPATLYERLPFPQVQGSSDSQTVMTVEIGSVGIPVAYGDHRPKRGRKLAWVAMMWICCCQAKGVCNSDIIFYTCAHANPLVSHLFEFKKVRLFFTSPPHSLMLAYESEPEPLPLPLPELDEDDDELLLDAFFFFDFIFFAPPAPSPPLASSTLSFSLSPLAFLASCPPPPPLPPPPSPALASPSPSPSRSLLLPPPPPSFPPSSLAAAPAVAAAAAGSSVAPSPFFPFFFFFFGWSSGFRV